MTTKLKLNDLTYRIIGTANEVHKTLGPGPLESVYHKCLKQELFLKEVSFSSELAVPINYKGTEVNAELRCDFLIEDEIVTELKAVDCMTPVFEAQLLKEGQQTYVNEYFRKLPDE